MRVSHCAISALVVSLGFACSSTPSPSGGGTGGNGAGADGGADGGGGGATAKTTNVPQRISIIFPATLRGASSAGGAGAPTGASFGHLHVEDTVGPPDGGPPPGAGGPGAPGGGPGGAGGAPSGYQQLQQALQMMQQQQDSTALQLAIFDQQYATVSATCAQSNGASWTKCSVPSSTVTFTQQFADLAVSILGGSGAPSDIVKSVNSEVGQSFPVPAMTIEKITNDPSGITMRVTITDTGAGAGAGGPSSGAGGPPAGGSAGGPPTDVGSAPDGGAPGAPPSGGAGSPPAGAPPMPTGTCALSWNDARTLVRSSCNQSLSMGTTGSTTMNMTSEFDAAHNLLTFSSNMSDPSGGGGKYLVTAQQLPQSGPNAARIQSTMSIHEQGMSLTLGVNGLFDDKGGFATTHFVSSQPNVTAATVSGTPLPTQGSQYLLAGATANLSASDNPFESALGIATGSGTADISQGLQYFGPATPPAALGLFPLTAGTAGPPTVGAALAGVTVAITLGAPTVMEQYIDQAFDASGNVTSSCTKSTPTGACASGAPVSGSYASGYQSQSQSGFDGAVTVTVAGVTAQSLKGDAFFIARADTTIQDGAAVSTVNPEKSAIGFGVFTASPSTPFATDLSQYQINYTGTAAEAATAKVFEITVDATKGIPVVKLLSGATVTASGQ